MFTFYYVVCNTDIDQYQYLTTNQRDSIPSFETVYEFDIESPDDIIEAFIHIENMNKEISNDSMFEMDGWADIFFAYGFYM